MLKASDMLSAKAIEEFEDDPLTYEAFHENTKITRANYPELRSHVDRLMLNKHFQESNPFTFKHYPGCKEFVLPPVAEAADIGLFEASHRRRTPKRFMPAAIKMSDLSYILYVCNGITGEVSYKHGKQCLRTVPSAGAMYPIDIYLGVRRVESLERGLYHFNVKTHSLFQLDSEDPSPLFRSMMIEEAYYEAGAFIVLAANFFRHTYKYRERGYRFSIIEAGQIAHAIALGAVSAGLSTLPVGGYFDDDFNRALKLDGVTESIVHLLLVG